MDDTQSRLIRARPHCFKNQMVFVMDTRLYYVEAKTNGRHYTDGLAANKHQAIIWTNSRLDYRCINSIILHAGNSSLWAKPFNL